MINEQTVNIDLIKVMTSNDYYDTPNFYNELTDYSNKHGV